MNRFATVALVACSVGCPIVAAGQDDPDAGPPPPATSPSKAANALRNAVMGLELSFLVPRGDFRPGHGVSVGYGVRGAVGLGPRRIVDLGAAYRSVAHDSRKYHDTVDVKNMLRTLTLNARLIAPLRHARPYIGGSVGGAYFGTETMVEECCNDEGDRQWSLDDIRLVRIRPTASARVGVLVDVWRSRGPGEPILSLDVGLEDHYGSRAAYQTGGNGPILRTGTNHRVYSLGVSIRQR